MTGLDPADTVSELRIIASDAGLRDADKAALIRGADELEAAQRAAVTLCAKLIETQMHLRATQERLLPSKPASFPFMSMSGIVA